MRQALLEHNLVAEDFGGETIFVDVSATKGTGVEKLLEMIALQAEVLELRANQKGAARGVVVARAGLGFEHLLPILPRVSQWHDRKKVIEAPLFPGYCFARLSVHNRSTVVQLPGVAYIVGSAGFSEVIPDEEIDALKRVTKCGMPYEAAMCLSEGDPVVIIRGPLAGVRGNLVRRERSHCVLIGVQLLQQGATVKIDAEDVRRIEEPAYSIGSGRSGRRAEPEYVAAR